MPAFGEARIQMAMVGVGSNCFGLLVAANIVIK